VRITIDRMSAGRNHAVQKNPISEKNFKGGRKANQVPEMMIERKPKKQNAPAGINSGDDTFVSPYVTPKQTIQTSPTKRAAGFTDNTRRWRTI
jgi:hypothetical protein